MTQRPLPEQRWFSQQKGRYALWHELCRLRHAAIVALAQEPLTGYKRWYAELTGVPVNCEHLVPSAEPARPVTSRRSPQLWDLHRKAVEAKIGPDESAGLRTSAMAPTTLWQKEWNLTADWWLDIIEYQYLYWLEEPGALTKIEPVPWREPGTRPFPPVNKTDTHGQVGSISEVLKMDAPLNGEIFFKDEVEGGLLEAMWCEPVEFKFAPNGIDTYSGERIAVGKKRLDGAYVEAYKAHRNDLEARAAKDGRCEFPAQHFEWLVERIVPEKPCGPLKKQEDIGVQGNVSNSTRCLAQFLGIQIPSRPRKQKPA